jgi:hypothetical protein
LIGEHYYGRIEFHCKSAGIGWKPFRTRFERVLFLGVRNCVESETTVDSDYCGLNVIAFRRSSDMNEQQGDLPLNTTDKREEYGFFGDGLAKNVSDTYGLAPRALARETINSSQFFRILMNQKAHEFLIPGDGRASGFHLENHSLQVDSDTFRNDQKLQAQIQQNLDRLDTAISRFRNARSTTKDSTQVLSEFVALYNQTARAVLQVVSPSAFFRLDRDLAERQAILAEDIHSEPKPPEPTAIAQGIQDYQKFSAYTRTRSSSQLDYKKALDLSFPVPTLDPIGLELSDLIGKVFMVGPIEPFRCLDTSRSIVEQGITGLVRFNSIWGENEVVAYFNGNYIWSYEKRYLNGNPWNNFAEFLLKARESGELSLAVAYTAETAARQISLKRCQKWLDANAGHLSELVTCSVTTNASAEGWIARAIVGLSMKMP